MPERDYWLDLFTGTTWQEFLDAGGKVSGFREYRRKTVKRIKLGDYLLCYLTGISRFIGILEVTTGLFEDDTPIWKDADFPCRLKVKIIGKLTPETAVPILDLKDRLSIFEDLTNPHAWIGHVRGSPAKWKREDGEAVVEAVLEAFENPIPRFFDPRKLAYRPKIFKSKVGPVTIPDDEVKEGEEREEITEDVSEHTEIQGTLLKLGSDIGLDVWVARNDRNRIYKGKPLSGLPRVRDKLPRQFDDATNRTIERIDILWLKGNSIVAAIEIEHSTVIYSGLLRLADLVAMQPNLNIPLYIVAPDERRDKVFQELNRPAFSRLSPRLNEICRFISYNTLIEKVAQASQFLRHLKPDFLEDISEPCEFEDV